MGSSNISFEQLRAAAQGNDAMRTVLEQMKAAIEDTATATATLPSARGGPTKAGTGQVTTPGATTNPSAAVPPQATGSVSILEGSYIVQLVNPGGTSPISQLQARQQAGNATATTVLQPVRTIYHQIRVSTSPAFNVNSNTQTFGGNTGSTQTYWTLTGLGSGTFYVQFRSTYDGVNFNTWKNANSGNALGGLVNQVTEENVGNANWALFPLPGTMIVGIGDGYCADGEIFDLASQLYSSGLFAIAGPDGFPPQGSAIGGFGLSDVDLQTPNPLPITSGPTDYPVVIRCLMNIAQNNNQAPSNASVFAIAVDPSNDNVTFYPDPGGTANWAVVQLPGGARIAIGQGKNTDGETIWTPAALTWLDGSRMMSICTLTDAALNQQPITGVNAAAITGLVVAGSYLDTAGNPVTGQGVNWLAIAWQAGADVQTIGGIPFLQIQLQGGHSIVIGAGPVAESASLTLPTGYTASNLLSICTPGGSDNSGHHLRGILQCAMFALTPSLVYTDNVNSWSGATNVMLASWV